MKDDIGGAEMRVRGENRDCEFVVMLNAISDCRKGDFADLQLIIDHVMQNGLAILQLCYGLRKPEYEQWLCVASFATFAPEQLVCWSLYGRTNRMAQLKARSGHGEGPFLVEKVENLSRHCTCGEIIEQNGWHAARCHKVQIRLHPQRLTLLTPKGPLVVSGRLLQPTR